MVSYLGKVSFRMKKEDRKREGEEIEKIEEKKRKKKTTQNPIIHPSILHPPPLEDFFTSSVVFCLLSLFLFLSVETLAKASVGFNSPDQGIPLLQVIFSEPLRNLSRLGWPRKHHISNL